MRYCLVRACVKIVSSERLCFLEASSLLYIGLQQISVESSLKFFFPFLDKIKYMRNSFMLIMLTCLVINEKRLSCPLAVYTIKVCTVLARKDYFIVNSFFCSRFMYYSHDKSRFLYRVVL